MFCLIKKSFFRVFRFYIQLFAAAPAIPIRQISQADPRSAMGTAVVCQLNADSGDKDRDTQAQHKEAYCRKLVLEEEETAQKHCKADDPQDPTKSQDFS